MRVVLGSGYSLYGSRTLILTRPDQPDLREEKPMRVRVATEGVRFVVVTHPAAKTDREGRQRVDGRTGALLWQLALVPIGDEYMREAITVTVDTEPTAAPGEFVEVTGLVAATWETEGRWGVAFRAARVTPAKAVKSVPSGSSTSAA